MPMTTFISDQSQGLRASAAIVADRDQTAVEETGTSRRRPPDVDAAGSSCYHARTTGVGLRKSSHRDRNAADFQRRSPHVGQGGRFRSDAYATEHDDLKTAKAQVRRWKFHVRARPAEGDSLRAAGRVIGNGQRAASISDLRGFESHTNSAARARCQWAAASVGLCKIPRIGAGDRNSTDREGDRAHIGQRHSLRRTGRSKDDRTDAQAGERELCGRADSR